MKLKNFSWSRIYFAVFIPVCVLYYFIRFQFGLDRQVLVVYTVMQGVVFVAVGASFLSWVMRRRIVNVYDKILLVVTLHVLLLTIVTVLRKPGVDSLLYAAKDYVFPLMLYWYCRRYVRANDWIFIYRMAAMTMTVASVIYVAEFFDRLVLGNPPFEYSQKVRELTMETTGSSELSGTVIKGDVFTLIRFEGPLSHNNVTGLGMAIGALLSYVLYKKNTLVLYLFMFSVNVVGLILAAPRTAIFSMLVAFAAYYWMNKRSGAAGGYGLYVSFVILAFLISLLMFFVLDLSTYGQIYDVGSILNTLVVIFTDSPELDGLFISLANPLKWFGVGFPVPGGFSEDYNVVRSDDIFFVQLVSMYGFVGVMLFATLLWSSIKHAIGTKVNPFSEEHTVYMLGVVVAVAMLISTIHTNAMVRPQLFPLYFLSLASMSAYMDRYRAYTDTVRRKI